METTLESGKKITLLELRSAFEDLISGAKTYEEVARWASDLMSSEDNGELYYEPSTHEDVIWKAIKYLSGVDLKNTPTEYLHCKEDFEDYLKEKLK